MHSAAGPPRDYGGVWITRCPVGAVRKTRIPIRTNSGRPPLDGSVHVGQVRREIDCAQHRLVGTPETKSVRAVALRNIPVRQPLDPRKLTRSRGRFFDPAAGGGHQSFQFLDRSLEFRPLMSQAAHKFPNLQHTALCRRILIPCDARPFLEASVAFSRARACVRESLRTR
jgi:hypothetical protein